MPGGKGAETGRSARSLAEEGVDQGLAERTETCDGGDSDLEKPGSEKTHKAPR